MFKNKTADEPKADTPENEKKVDFSKPPAVPDLEANMPKPPASVISKDLKIIGDLETDGDVQIEGEIEGNIRGNLVTIGKDAKIKGEVAAHDLVVNGHISGSVRGNKVRLSTSAEVAGDITHKEIAIESGAHFEGSMHRSENPLDKKSK